jgi:LysR family glycine cleavage system transcriptional activator
LHGDGNWPGLEATQLCAEEIFAICSPKLLVGRDRLRRPADVLKWPLLRLEDQSEGWERWFTLAGVTPPERLPGPVLNRASMLIDAAIDGQGVALARTALASWDLINRRIVKPFGVSWQPAGTYWIVSPKATAKLAKIGASATGCSGRQPTMPCNAEVGQYPLSLAQVNRQVGECGQDLV